MNLFNVLKDKGYEPEHSGHSIKIRCPYHDEDTPSCSIDESRGIFKCFGCEAAGPIEKLLFDLGIRDGYTTNLLEIAQNKVSEKITSLLSEFTLYPKGAKPINQEYRGIKPETFDYFNAYTLNDKDSIFFPIKFRGKNMGVIENPIGGKYINRFVNGYIPFNIDRVSSGNIILVEGIYDALSVFQAGYKNVIASLSASYSYSLIKWLKIINAKNIQILYDGDEAGRKGAKQLSLKYLDSTIFNLPEGTDPNSLSNLKEYLQVQGVKK